MNRLLPPALTVTLALVPLASCTERTPTEPLAGHDPAPTTAEVAAAAANGWTALAAMPTGRLTLAAAVVTNAQNHPVLYAIGGDDGSQVTLSTVEAYDFVTRTWNARAPMPVRLEETNGAGVIGGRIYVSGGRDLDNASPGSDDGAPRSSLYVYDPVANRWSRKADMPQPSMSGVTGAIDDKLYVLNATFNRFYRYDPATDSWSVLPRCPGRHFRGAGAVIRGKLYVAGGVRFGINGPIAIRRLHVYDPGTNTWSERAPMPRAVYLSAAARLLGQLYVLGGDAKDVGRRYVQAYDPATDTWALKAPLPTFRAGLAAASVVLDGEQRIVAIGGYGGTDERWLRSNDLYTP